MSEQYRDSIPDNTIEFQFGLLQTSWGKGKMPKELHDYMMFTKRKTLKKGTLIQDKDGYVTPLLNNAYQEERVNLNEQLSIYPMDFRLSNLDKQALREVQHFLFLCGDFLREGFRFACNTAMQRSVVLNDTNQSRGGWRVKELGKQRREEKFTQEVPKKKSALYNKNG